ncbi:MAG: SDR family oxidoreductase [Saprospiraceae bacterium]|nr:SDR family oxidoreductase [Saprospiraceae bacterium]
MNIIITGASRGIGYDTALQLAKDPKNKVLAISRNEEKLAQLAESSPLQNVDYLAYDLSRPNKDALVKKIAGWDSVDILINNAGLLRNKPFAKLTDKDWWEIFEVNVFGITRLIRLLLPQLRSKEGAHIINMGSMGGVQGSSKFKGLSAYSASKAALANLTECLAEELKEDKISVNCLALGAVQTEMLAEAFPGYQAPVESNQMGEMVAWFAVQGKAFFNGKILPVSISTP